MVLKKKVFGNNSLGDQSGVSSLIMSPRSARIYQAKQSLKQPSTPSVFKVELDKFF